MRRHIAVMIAGTFVLSVTHTLIAQHSHSERDHEHEQQQEHEKIQKYTCLMHPEVITDHPGNCPKCGMKLVPIKEEKRSTLNSDRSRAGAQRSISKHQSHSSHMSAAASAKEDASHEMHEMHPPSVAAATSGAAGEHEHGHEHELGQRMHMEMHSAINLADPMSREGSGTSWIPDSSPMYGRMYMFGESMLMLHGAIIPRYTNVSTRRGDDRIAAPNWFMGMYSRPHWDIAQFGSRLMMSLDPLTEGGRG